MPRNSSLQERGLIVQTESVSSTAFASVITALTSTIDVASVVEVLAYTAGICVGLVFMWWGVRKALRALMGAFRSGKMRL